MTDSMFPDWDETHNVKFRKALKTARPKTYEPEGMELQVLALLDRRDTADDKSIVGELIGRHDGPDADRRKRKTTSTILAAVERLAKHRLIVDTGERGDWFLGHRSIVWRRVEQSKAARS